MSTLEIKDLHAYYGKSHVLHGVDLNVGEGEIVSLLGRNGVGRSTTVKSTMGHVDVTGSIKLPEGQEMVMPGDNTNMEIDMHQPIAMDQGLRFAIREGGRTVGAGVVTDIIT